jgi:hypothetical protein
MNGALLAIIPHGRSMRCACINTADVLAVREFWRRSLTRSSLVYSIRLHIAQLKGGK